MSANAKAKETIKIILEFEIRLKSGDWTRVHEYDMATALAVTGDETGAHIRSIEEVADSGGTKAQVDKLPQK